jgi:hypothetical protein
MNLSSIRSFVSKHYFPFFLIADVVIYSTLFILIASALS